MFSRMILDTSRVMLEALFLRVSYEHDIVTGFMELTIHPLLTDCDLLQYATVDPTQCSSERCD